MTPASWASTALVMFKVSMVLGSCSVLALQAQMVIPLCLLLGEAHSGQKFKRRGWVLGTWERLWILYVLELKPEGAGGSLAV